MQKGFAFILIVIGILVITVVAGGVYFIGKSQTPKPQVQNPVVSQTSQPTIIPSSAPDETVYTEASRSANWKTYTKLGYEIKYPQSSVITEYSLDPSMPDLLSSTSTEVKIDDRQAPVLFLVSVWKNMGVNIIDSASREKWCSLLEKELTGQLQCRYEESLSVVKVNGYTAYQVTGGRDSTLIKTIYIPHNDYVYELTIPTGEDTEKKFSVSDQILSTFRFTQ